MNGDEMPPPTDEEAAEALREPARLPDYLEETGVEAAAEDVRRMLRYGAADVPGMSDTEVLRNAAVCEEAAAEWPPDVTARLLSFVYRAEVLRRMESDGPRGLFRRMARKVGYTRRPTAKLPELRNG